MNLQVGIFKEKFQKKYSTKMVDIIKVEEM